MPPPFRGYPSVMPGLPSAFGEPVQYPNPPQTPPQPPPWYPPGLPGQPPLSGWPQLPYPPGHLPPPPDPPYSPPINTTPLPPGTPYPTFPGRKSDPYIRELVGWPSPPPPPMTWPPGPPPPQYPQVPIDPNRRHGIPPTQRQLMMEGVMDRFGPPRYHR